MNSNNYLKFNEPGLLIKLSGESDFPKNIKEDEPFPEFMNYNKRQRLCWGEIAQWIHLRLPFCGPGFQSQAHHLCLN